MYERIMVPLDGSKLAEIALPHAESLAGRYDAQLVLMTVVETPPLTGRGTQAMELVQQQLETLWQDAELYLRGLQGEFKKKKIKTDIFVKNGPVVESIVDTSEDLSVDLVVIASHGRTGLKRVFFGSVAVGLLNRTEKPLLMVRSPH